MKHMGQWVQFQTPWGSHRGIIAGVNQNAVLVRVPRRFAPMGLATANTSNANDETRLNLALTQWGYDGYGGGGYGGYPGYGYGGKWGYPGYGAWNGGWWWWWLAFAWIFALALFW